MCRLLVLALALRVLGAGADVRKQVVNTAWWPPGTERKAESVGIISHGFVYMTAMMEHNDTLAETTQAELKDVRDIAEAAGAGLENLVDCLANAPKGGAAAVRQAFERALAAKLPKGAALPALTVVEAPGEYAYFNVSISCVAALPGAPRRALRAGSAYGVSARGLLHLESSGTLDAALHSLEHLVRKAGASGLHSVAECTAFLQDVRRAAPLLRRALGSGTGARGPALTVVQAGLEVGKAVALRCVAAVPANGAGGGGSSNGAIEHHSKDVVVARRFAFVAGQRARLTNGTDGFDALEQALSIAGVGLSDVVSCLFFVTDQAQVFDLFDGFFDVFNAKHPPPPARAELQAETECGDCAVMMRCIAAMPAAVELTTAELPGQEMLV
mmetsp:Transcript_75605/g.245822  ORF Transcript_75605/g.245822 Transcript_75605/m.245822 type:complete len:386 (+) Transcript_75605:106-1263(+)